MRLLFLIHTVDPRAGGPATTLRQLIPELLKQGLEVEVCCLDVEPSLNVLPPYPCKVHFLGGRSKASASANFTSETETNHAVGKPTKDKGTIGQYGWNWGLVSWLCANAGRFDHVVVRGIWQWISAATLLASLKTGMRYSIFVHGMLDPWFKKQYPAKHLKKQLYWLLVEYWVLRRAHAVLYTTEQERSLASQSFIPYHCNAQVVRYGIADSPYDRETASAEFHASFPALKDRRFAVFLGRLHEKKGVDLLLRGFAEAAPLDLHLVLAGPSQNEAYVRRLHQLVDELSLSDRVHWLGMVDGPRKWGCLYLASAFALISYQENFGVAVVEALSCQTPVLLSWDVAVSSTVVEAGAGIANVATEAGSAALFEEFFSLAEDERMAIGQRGRDLFLREFSIDSAAKSLTKVLTTAAA